MNRLLLSASLPCLNVKVDLYCVFIVYYMYYTGLSLRHQEGHPRGPTPGVLVRGTMALMPGCWEHKARLIPGLSVGGQLAQGGHHLRAVQGGEILTLAHQNKTQRRLRVRGWIYNLIGFHYLLHCSSALLS